MSVIGNDKAIERRVVRMGFGPMADPDTAAVFNDDLARTFYLCWRPRHVVSQHFPVLCLRIANRLRKLPPTSSLDEIANALSLDFQGWLDISPTDAAAFVPEFLPYLRGEKTIEYEVVE